MTRRPLSYDNLTILEEVPAAPAASVVAPATPVQTADSDLLRDISHQTMLYLHVDGVKALDEYALAKSTLHHKIKRHESSLRRSKNGPRSAGSRHSSGRKSGSLKPSGDTWL